LKGEQQKKDFKEKKRFEDRKLEEWPTGGRKESLTGGFILSQPRALKRNHQSGRALSGD